MRRKILCILMCMLLLFAVSCNNNMNRDDVPERTFPPINDPVEIKTPSKISQTGEEPATKKLNILDFFDISKASDVIKLTDLSVYGIVNPEVTIDDNALVFSFEKAKNNGWCQAFDFVRTTTLKNAISEISDDLYLRIFIETSDDLPIHLTVAFSGSNKYYFDCSKAVLTTSLGEALSFTTSNASSGAGENSSIDIPGGFSGWVAFKVTDTKLWGTGEEKRPTKISSLYFDVRTQNAREDSYYRLSDICFANSEKGGIYSVTEYTTKMDFLTKSDELAYKTNQLTTEAPEYTYCPEYDPVGYDNVKAIWITGPKIGDKETRVFAYIGIPESKNEKIPGIVLQHGGGGFAYPNWVKMWNDEGYAAIAICNTGYYPSAYGITDFYTASSWTHTLSSELEKEGKILPPDNDGMSTYASSLDSQWMYHAVCQTIIGNNILRSLDEVDENKVGITGISWGGVITSTVLGYDDRFAFAVPVYGSAFLKDNKSNLCANHSVKECIDLWEPANRIDYVDTKTLWLCWTNDVCFSINSNSDSYLHTKDYSYLSAIMDLGHGHLEGWCRPEIVRFANSVVKGGEGLIKVIEEPIIKDGKIEVKISVPKGGKDVEAKLYYLKGKMTYSFNGEQSKTWTTLKTMDQKWNEVSCEVHGDTVYVNVPTDLVGYYIELSFSDGENRLVTSTAYIEK